MAVYEHLRQNLLGPADTQEKRVRSSWVSEASPPSSSYFTSCGCRAYLVAGVFGIAAVGTMM